MAIIPASPPELSFIVEGLPAPQGSKAFKGMSKKSGRAILVESSKKVKPWRSVVAAAASAAQGPDWVPLGGPLLLVIEFYMPRPKSHPKTRRTLPDRTPDLSKLLRSTEDALTTAGTYEDDGRIVDHVIRERYSASFPNLSLPHELPFNGARIAVWRVLPEATVVELPIVPFAPATWAELEVAA